MAIPPPLKIDLSEKFEHLSNAAITEAVIEFRAPAVSLFGEATVKSRLKNELPDYPKQSPMRTATIQVNVQMGAGSGSPTQSPPGDVHGHGPEPVSASVPKSQWDGIRAKSEDEHRVASFKPTAFAFSMLHPYSHWDDFSAEAMRLWTVHNGLARVEKIQRIGVRYINQITIPQVSFEVSDYFVNVPPDPKGIALSTSTFLYQDTFIIPGQPYSINCIRTIRPPTPPKESWGKLVLDMDVFTTVPVPLSEMHSRLAEMRWLKNKLFFGIVTDKTLALLR
jgi:uncharacterized protein (TIGR04255 family)